MKNRNKSILTVILSALAGSLFGGIIVGFIVIKFSGQFFNDYSVLSSSNQLNTNIWALESIRNGDNAKALKLLEQEARNNLVSAGANNDILPNETNKALQTSINNAKKYFDKNPFKYINENEKILIEQAYSKIGNVSHNKALKRDK